MKPISSLYSLLRDVLVVDSAKILAINIAGAALAFLSHVLFARWLGVDSYGVYVLALSILNILFIAQQAGLNLSVIRLVSEHRAAGNGAATRALVRFSNKIILILGVASAGVGGIWLLAVREDMSDELTWTMAAMLALSVLLALFQQRSAILQGLERVVHAALSFEIIRPLLLLAVVWALVQTRPADAALVMTANLIVTGAVLAAVAVYARACVKAEPTGNHPAPEWRRWLEISLPYVLVTGLTIVLTQMDVLMIGALLGTEQAGLYAPAAKVALLATFPTVAVRQRFGPMAARLFAENQFDRLQARLTSATGLSVVTCLCVVIVIVPGRDLILGLFGAEYQAGALLIVVLSTGYLIYSIGAVEMFFLVGPFERLNAVVAALTLGINFLLNLVLIPHLGILGAAYATAGAIVVRALLSAVIVHHRTGLRPFHLTSGATGAAGS